MSGRLGRPELRGANVGVALVGILLSIAGPAAAQPYAPPPPPPPYAPPPPPPPVERSGFTIAVGLGLGAMDISADSDSESYSTLLFDLSLGGMISPNAALLIELFGGPAASSDTSAEGVEVSQSNIGIGLQYWARPRLWLKPGFATSRLEVSVSDFESVTFEGPTIYGAAGYELASRPNYSLDLALRLHATFYREDDFDGGGLQSTTGAAMLGFRWY